METRSSILFIFMISGIFSSQVIVGKTPLTKPEVIHSLYQLMKDIHELFEAHGVQYWAYGGTLLGSVRNGGIIPWDDDLDIQVDVKNAHQIKALAPLIKKLGYSFHPCYLGFQITAEHNAHMDIFLVKREGPYYVFNTKKAQGTFKAADHGDLQFKPEDIFPLKKYRFGDLEIWGPHNHRGSLDSKYGKKWNSVARLYNHTFIKNRKRRLKNDDLIFQAAQPFGPLEDRVAALT